MPTKRFKNLEPERREQILKPAQAEFTKNGYEGASLNAIIGEAGISKGSLYYYFEDKADLYMTVLENVMKEIQVHAGGIAVGEFSDDFWDDIEQYTKTTMKIIKENPDFIRLARGIFLLSSPASMPDSVAEFFQLWKQELSSIILRGQEMKEVRTDMPLGLLVDIIWSLGETVDLWIFNHIDELSPEELDRHAVLYTDLWKRLLGAHTKTK